MAEEVTEDPGPVIQFLQEKSRQGCRYRNLARHLLVENSPGLSCRCASRRAALTIPYRVRHPLGVK